MSLDLFAVLLGGAVYLLPVFAKDILNVGPIGFGWLRAAPSFGAVTMALVLAHRPPMKHAGRALLLGRRRLRRRDARLRPLQELLAQLRDADR